MIFNVVRLSRPLYLIFAALTYILGGAVAAYLGNPYAAPAFWAGLAIVLLSQAAMSLLKEVFRPVADPILVDETIARRRALRDVLLYTAIIALAAAAVLAFILFSTGRAAPQALVFIIVAIVLPLVYGVPPLRLAQMGFGEVILALYLGYIVPSLAFLLQAAEYHRLLAMMVFPLTCLALACFIALNFQPFAQDRKYNRGTLLVRLGWERAVPLHQILIAGAYFILLSAPLFGITLGLIWPAFLTLPFAALQVFALRGIAQGSKPIWPLLSATAISVFGLTAYFLTLTFWLR